MVYSKTYALVFFLDTVTLKEKSFRKIYSTMGLVSREPLLLNKSTDTDWLDSDLTRVGVGIVCGSLGVRARVFYCFIFSVDICFWLQHNSLRLLPLPDAGGGGQISLLLPAPVRVSRRIRGRPHNTGTGVSSGYGGTFRRGHRRHRVKFVHLDTGHHLRVFRNL